MKKLFLLVAFLGLISCVEKGNLIKDARLQKSIRERLDDRKGWLPERQLEATLNESEGLDFLYAYMGMGDAVDFSEQLYLTNVKSSLRAQTEMPWGNVVPNDLFLHFVLPVRVNNENLDTSRVDFYEELKDRVSGLSMEDAILEVNHWCHEKVVYTPSDSRTSSPSSTVKSAYGRCGEESTFTVAALRAVGIPARQIYTPRWAHTDDNHAWVEAWANGKWHYIGACEPEPVLNCGWFDSPAKRGMLMFTKVFGGDYQSNEEVIERTDGYTEINVTKNYAPVKLNSVKVVDAHNNAVKGADVLYTIYNYAQFYPCVRKISDKNGESELTTGKGDMIIFASKDSLYGRAKIGIDETEVVVVLNRKQKDVFSEVVDIVPPVELPVDNGITPQMRKANDIRFAREDSIRGAYVGTFINEVQSAQFAQKMGLADGRIWSILSKSRGNYADVMAFIESSSDKEVALDLLEVISDKDVRDMPVSVLGDHLEGSLKYKEDPLYKEYILNPRVDDELVVKFRDILGGGLTFEQIKKKIAGIALRENLNPAKLKITPIGVDRLQMSDVPALERYAIIIYRSNGVPARREPITEKPQYFDGKEWVYIEFPQISNATGVVGKGSVKIELVKNSFLDDPKCYTHFTLGKFKDGEFVTLNLRRLANDMGEGISYKTILNKPLELEEGTYQLITGTRMSDGSVATMSEVFTVEAGKESNVKMTMRENKNKLQVIGACDPETLYVPSGSEEPKSILSTTGRGYFILAVIDAKKEPTTHFLRGLESINAELTAWGRPIVLVLEDKSKMQHFNLAEFPNLPKSVSYGYDYDQKVLDMLYRMMKLDNNSQLPIVVVGDSFGKVVYKSTGYNTSVGQQLKEIIAQL